MRSFLLLALPLVGRVLCSPEAPPASPTKETSPNPFYANAQEAFRDLLNALPEESLKAALNGLEKYQDGIFESNRHGVERVHNENPPLATKLIVAAVQDLKKRQTPSNGTTQAPPPPVSSAPPPPPPQSSQGPPANVPIEISTTDSNGQPTVVSSVFLSQPTASIAVPVTRTNDQGQTFVSSETKPAVIQTKTDSAGSTYVTTSAVELAPTAGQVITTTNAEGSTFVTTYTPEAGLVSSILLITTTGPNGEQEVITSYTFINPAGVPTGTDGKPLPSQTAGRPGLQSGAADKSKATNAAMWGGAFGGLLAIFL